MGSFPNQQAELDISQAVHSVLKQNHLQMTEQIESHPIAVNIRFPTCLLIQGRELFSEMLDLGLVVDDNVGLGRMQGQIVLVVRFGEIELLQRGDLRHDGFAIRTIGGELLDLR